MASQRSPGPLCRYRLVEEIDSGTLCRHASPRPGPVGGLSLWPELYEPDFLPAALGMSEAITDEDKAEFRVIKTMPVYDQKRQPYRTIGSYISDRTLYFGPPSVYRAFAAESDAELANTKWVRKKRTRTLRSMLEFGRNARQQEIFYRWVRMAYKRKYGKDANVPELIRKGMSQELADQIAAVRGSLRVKEIHAEQFKAGGFNPRPVKFRQHYLLGTLSEHATGMAVDIDDTRNAQLTLDDWKFVERLVGKHVPRSGRWTTEAAAEGLWKDIKEVNDLFVTQVASEVQRIEKERAEKARKEAEEGKDGAEGKAAAKPAPKHHKVITPLEEVLGTHFKALSRWAADGFFQLPLELVLELRFQGFIWGATFGTNVDLHHFELKD